MYTKLPSPRSIRLLDIAPGKVPDRIEGSLMVVNLNEAPAFEALSYVWGTLNDPLEIICDNEIASVPQNLHGALQRLRRVDEPRRVWIDALCINQFDFDERAQQVSFMKDIYARAKRVVVWLGPDEGGKAALAVTIISSATKYMIQRGKEVSAQETMEEDEKAFQLKVGAELPPRGHYHWKAVGWLFSREWFSRVWIIQEIAQDLRAIVMVGDQTTSFFAVTSAAMLFHARSCYIMFEDWLTMLPVIIAYFAFRKDRRPLRLLENLNGFSMFNATNPRDKLYAILGLSQEGQELDKYPLIQPDYWKSVLQTYTDLVRQLISAPRSQAYGQGGLDVLGRTNLARHIEFRCPPQLDNQGYWPSWVPHFCNSVPFYMSLSAFEQALSWNTSYDSAVELGPVQKGSLVLKGVRLSTVEKLYTDPEYYQPDVLNLASLFEQVTKDLVDYGGPGTVAEAFAGTITAGDPNVVSEDDLVRYLRSRAGDASIHHPDRFQEMVNPIMDDQMFLSSDGRMGMGQRPLLGSEVWLLFGGRTLYLLNRVDTCYVFVGECYVHGYMSGEGMDMWKAGKLQSEWVELR